MKRLKLEDRLWKCVVCWLVLRLAGPKRCLATMFFVRFEPQATARYAIQLVKAGLFWSELAATEGDVPDALNAWLGPRFVLRRLDYFSSVADHFERIGNFESVFE